LAFGGAQKNLGPAGLTIVIVREDLIGHALPICPTAFDYAQVAKSDSMYNTPPTYAIYMAGLVFDWIKNQQHEGLHGVAAIERINQQKAELLYGYIDQSPLYVNTVDVNCRSRMNVPFFLRGDDGQPLLDPAHPRNAAFLEQSKAAGLLQLKGHKSVGGMRASIYNAMPLHGVQALVAFMRQFEQTQG
jgi:phosphoserine aminotransferase